MTVRMSLKKMDSENYVKYLKRMFRMKDSFGNVMDYVPTWYQIEWHKLFFLVNPEIETRIWSKGRGLGATITTMMDLILTALIYNDLKIPV